MTNPEEYSLPLLILCEGMTDKKVLHRIIAAHEPLHGKCEIKFPSINSNRVGGNTNFARWLGTRKMSSSFQNIKLVVILTDADSDRQKSFSDIILSLNAEHLPCPDNEGEISKDIGGPFRTAVIVIPFEGEGCIETLCADPLADRFSVTTEVDKFLAERGVDQWKTSQFSKAKLHVTIAITCEPRPDASLSNIWDERERYHIPIDENLLKISLKIEELASEANIL
jgi:hypothetical protein